MTIHGARVTRVRVRTVAVPFDKPLDTPVGLLGERDYVLVEVSSTEGLTGIGYIRAYDPATVAAARAFVESIGARIVGVPVASTEALYESMLSTLRLLGRAGTHMYAISALDTALWDLKARHLELPLFRLLGAARERVAVYASGLMLDASKPQLVDEVQEAVAQGMRAVKMRVGKPDLADDVSRVTAVRDTFDGQLMLDAGTAWSAPEAARAVRHLADLDITWLEDPLPVDATAALARLNHASAVPLAGGEHLYKHSDLATHLSLGTYDYMIFDLQRIGGVTGWVRASHLAAAHGMRIASHVFPEVAAHLVCGLASGLIVEYLPWSYELFEEPPLQENGEIAPAETSGLGLVLDEQFIARHEMGQESVVQ